jgi:hypothetical protein
LRVDCLMMFNAFRHCVRRYLWTQVRIYAKYISEYISDNMSEYM